MPHDDRLQDQRHVFQANSSQAPNQRLNRYHCSDCLDSSPQNTSCCSGYFHRQIERVNRCGAEVRRDTQNTKRCGHDRRRCSSHQHCRLECQRCDRGPNHRQSDQRTSDIERSPQCSNGSPGHSQRCHDDRDLWTKRLIGFDERNGLADQLGYVPNHLRQRRGQRRPELGCQHSDSTREHREFSRQFRGCGDILSRQYQTQRLGFRPHFGESCRSEFQQGQQFRSGRPKQLLSLRQSFLVRSQSCDLIGVLIELGRVESVLGEFHQTRFQIRHIDINRLGSMTQLGEVLGTGPGRPGDLKQCLTSRCARLADSQQAATESDTQQCQPLADRHCVRRELL